MYSIGAYTTNGREVSGGSHPTLEQAQEVMRDLIARRNDLASISIFKWDGDECEEIDFWQS